jgi:hypothetical protein
MFDEELREGRLRSTLRGSHWWDVNLVGPTLRLANQAERVTILVARKPYPELMVSGEIRLTNPQGGHS